MDDKITQLLAEALFRDLENFIIGIKAAKTDEERLEFAAFVLGHIFEKLELTDAIPPLGESRDVICAMLAPIFLAGVA